MDEIVTSLLANPNFRMLIEDIVVRVVAEILHRRASDPEYLAKSDSAFELLSNASTDQEKIDAHLAIAALIAS